MKREADVGVLIFLAWPRLALAKGSFREIWNIHLRNLSPRRTLTLSAYLRDQ